MLICRWGFSIGRRRCLSIGLGPGQLRKASASRQQGQRQKVTIHSPAFLNSMCYAGSHVLFPLYPNPVRHTNNRKTSRFLGDTIIGCVRTRVKREENQYAFSLVTKMPGATEPFLSLHFLQKNTRMPPGRRFVSPRVPRIRPFVCLPGAASRASAEGLRLHLHRKSDIT